MNEIMEDCGGNNYRIPHIGKSKMEKALGKLPDAIEVTPIALTYLAMEPSNEEESEDEEETELVAV
jgi:hypothetical protein